MNAKEFERCLDLYGADLERWPEALQVGGRQAAAAFPDLLETAREMESMLRAEDPIPTREGLAERIIAASLRTPPAKDASWKDWWRGLWRPVPALTFASLLMIGLATGYWLRSEVPSNGNGNDLASLLYSEEQILW